MGIRHIGGRSAQTLAKYFGTFEKVLSVNQKELEEIKRQEQEKKKVLKKKRDKHEISEEEYTEESENLRESERLTDIGKEMIKSLCDYITNPKNEAMIRELISVGIEPEEQKVRKTGKLAGKTIVVTGALEHFTRQQIEQAIRQAGGKPSSSVSKKTDFVLAGEGPGSKLDEAKKLGVKVITEKQFLELTRMGS